MGVIVHKQASRPFMPSEHAALYAGVEELALDLEARNIAGGCNISNRLHHKDEIDGKYWQDKRAVYAQGEGFDPDKRD